MKLLDAFRAAGDRAVVSGRVTAEKPPTASGFIPSTIDDLEPRVYRGRIHADILYSGNMMLPRRAMEEVGSFDERLGGGATFPSAEDNDLAYRLLEAGYAIHYAPEAIVVHRTWRGGADYLALRWRYARGQGGFYGKHLSLRDRHMLRRVYDEVRVCGIRVTRLLFREPGRAMGEVVHIGGLLSGMIQWLLTQRG